MSNAVKSKLWLILALIMQNHSMRASPLVNGGFEAATNAATLNSVSLSSGSTNIPGWTTTNAELTWDGAALHLSPPLTAAQGSDYLDLTGVHDSSPYGAVFQTIETTPGQPYQVSFEVGSDKYYDSYYTGTFDAPIVTVSLNGVAAFSATNNFPSFSNYWQNWTFSFTADAANTTLLFTGATSNATRVGYIGLDNVSVTGGSVGIVIVLSGPTVSDGQVQIPFAVTNGSASNFTLLQSAQVNGPWMTNNGAILATNVPGVSYTFTAVRAGPEEFYIVQSP
jgi:hypothetical protein